MSLFGPEMNKTATYAPASSVGRDEDLNLSVGSQETISIRWEPESHRERASDGSVKSTKDVLYTEHKVTDQDVFWPPGRDPTNPDDFVEPTKVVPTPSLDGADTLYKVIL